MNLTLRNKIQGFTLVEVVIAAAIGSMILAAIITSAVSLHRTFAAVDDFFSVHLQQIRIIDYLSRDVKRSTIVHSTDKNTLSCWIPKYIIEAGDTDAASGVGKRRTPVINYTPSGFVVDYYTTTQENGPRNTDGTPVLDTWGLPIKTSASTVTYSISGNSILRTENGVVTAIASSTDQLVPDIIDLGLLNAGSLQSEVSFRPIFTSLNAASERAGTTIYSTQFLRNLRRSN